MTWGFETDAEFQQELDWIDAFIRTEVDPLEFVLEDPYDVTNSDFQRLVRPLQQIVKERGLWACHLGPDLGGQGFGQVKLALMNEILGGAKFGPVVFGCQAPDSGNAEILARYGTVEQREQYLSPLLENHIVSCFSMTEPQGGSDPTQIATRAHRCSDGWRINGEKWFATNASRAEFFIIMAATDPEAPPHRRMSAFIVPRATSGIEIIRNSGYVAAQKTHAYLRLTDVRVPADHILGSPGEGFVVAQTRLGGGRIHHAMRTIAKARKALSYMQRRALSRTTQGELLARKQMVQEKIADSWIELEQFRLLVLNTAWLIAKHQDDRKLRKDIAAVKAAMRKVLHDIASRALHVHGSLGLSDEMPFMHWVTESYFLGLADGPTEVHKITLAKELLRDSGSDSTSFPDYHVLERAAHAYKKYGVAP